MSRKPITMNAGQPEQLPDGAALNVGGWDLPASIGTVLYTLVSNGSNGVWAQLDHGTHIAGLSDLADHPQYLAVDGSRALAGDWSLGGYNLTNVGLFGGVDVPEVNSFFNGTFQETFDAVVTSDGATITMSLEQAGTGDLTMQFSDGYTTLDCTSPLQTIVLTAGASDAAPQANYIYIPQSTKVLTKSTSTWPAGEHIRVAYFLVPSATFVNVHGCYVNQNWNDHQAGADSQGHMAHMSEKLRRLGAAWFSGVNANGATASYFTIGFNTTDWLSTEGEVDQLHEHTFPAVETSGSDTVLVVNQSGAAYDDIYDLYSITDDNTGATISNNRYFNLVFWGVVNKSDEFAALMVNLPGGFYVQQGEALIDSDGHDVYDIPREFSIDSGTAFLICRTTFKMGTTWTHVSTTDLRGLTPATASGSSVNDHGGLGGLTDDDHTAYHTDARAATWLAANHETTYNHANYDIAYGWGDHASGGYLKADGTVPLTAHWAAGAYNITGLVSLAASGTVVGSNIPSPSGDDQVLVSTASGVASWITAGNNQYLASNSSGNVRWENKTGDASLWIATTGNDSTGDGTEGDPYATIGKCITEFQAMSFDPGDTATINFEDGEYTGLSTITLPRMVPMLKLAGRAAYSFTMSDTVSQANVAGNVYDLRITLDTTTNISAGNFVVIPRCASLPELNGCWEVQTVHDSTDITIRVTWAREAPHIGAYAATVAVPRAHFNRTGGTFLAVYTHLTLNGLIFEGTAGRGILLFAGTTLEIRSYVGFSGWDYGLYISAATVDIQYCAISNCTNGMNLISTSSAVVQWIAISGCPKGYVIDRLSHLYIGDESYAASCYWGMIVQFGSSAKIFFAVFINNTTQGIEASFGAIIQIAGCTFTDNVSDYSPALDTQGNDNSWITT